MIRPDFILSRLFKAITRCYKKVGYVFKISKLEILDNYYI